MKLLPFALALAGPCALPLARAGEPSPAPEAANPAAPNYESVAQIKAMPACVAKVMEVGPCYAECKTADGKTLFLGSPAAPREVVRFIRTLKEGQTCQLPEAFVAYLQKAAQ
jgi:hypothetical protein